LNIDNDDFVIVTVCRLVKRKGVEYLIEAISLIKDKNIKLIVVGDGPERKNLELIKDKYDLKDRVIFVGKVPDLSIYYSIAKVGSLVSYTIENEGDFEGLGLVLLEAQLYGLPVIGTRSGGIPEAIEDGKTGFVVDERNANTISDSILKLKNDNSLYNKMKSNTKVFLQNRFGHENTVRKTILSILKK
jgi:glycosyltransferase involved in cell wall biosynthesis